MTDASLRRARKIDLAQAARPGSADQAAERAGSRADAAASDAPHSRAASCRAHGGTSPSQACWPRPRSGSAPRASRDRSGLQGRAPPCAGGAVGSASPGANCQPRQTGPASLLVLPARPQGSWPALTAPPGSRSSAAGPGRRPAPRARRRGRQRAARQAAPDCRGGITRPHPGCPGSLATPPAGDS